VYSVFITLPESNLTICIQLKLVRLQEFCKLSKVVMQLDVVVRNICRQFKARPHCRREVRLSQKSAPNFAVVSPFSATVALFCDSVDRSLVCLVMTLVWNMVWQCVRTARAAVLGVQPTTVLNALPATSATCAMPIPSAVSVSHPVVLSSSSSL